MAHWDRAKAVAYLTAHAKHVSQGLCARYTREAIEAGGLALQRVLFARDYGAPLEAVGFTKRLEPVPGGYMAGDVVVIQGFAESPEGHMAMFDGRNWVSDFPQRELYPGPVYRIKRPKYVIYRFISG